MSSRIKGTLIVVWFDVSCLDQPIDSQRPSHPLGEQLTRVPIVRGWDSCLPDKWKTVGTGRLVEKAIELFGKDSCPDWVGLLGDEVQTLPPSLWDTYSCLNCGGQI
jgi:hypothetical protein